MPKTTKIEDLPQEVLIPIFNYLPTKQLNDLSTILPKWKDVIENEIGYEITLSDASKVAEIGKNTNTDTATVKVKNPLRNVHLHRIARVAVQICHVNLTIETGFKKDTSVFKYPAKLRVLTFRAPTSPLGFQCFTKNTEYLKKLQFGYSSLVGSYLFDKLIPTEINLPNLESLQINDNSLESVEFSSELEEVYLNENILWLLSQNYPSIKELDVSIVINHFSTKEYVLALFKLLQQHFNSIKIVSFSIINSILRILRNTDARNQYVEFTETELEEIDLNELKKVQLSKLELDLGRNYVVGLNVLSELITSQKLLKSISIFKEAPITQTIFSNIVNNNYANLSYLQIGIQIISDNGFDVTPINCNVLEPCLGLRKLVLIGNVKEDFMIEKQLLNVEKLPQRILTLCLKDICIESKDILTIIDRLNHIIKLTLTNIGTKDEFGITIEMLDKILKERKCMELIIKGFNPLNSGNCGHIIQEMEIPIESLPTINFHTKYCYDLQQYISICS